MLDLQRALKNDRLLRALTGLNLKAFEELKADFAQVLTTAEVPRRSPQPRQRATGAGRKPRLATVEAKLFFILFYFKVYPTFDLAGLLFDLDRSQANRWMHRLQPLVEQTLGQKLALPKRQLTSLEEFVEAFPSVEHHPLDGGKGRFNGPKTMSNRKPIIRARRNGTPAVIWVRWPLTAAFWS
jgi:hypothetical protein